LREIALTCKAIVTLLLIVTGSINLGSLTSNGRYYSNGSNNGLIGRLIATTIARRRENSK